MARQMSLKDRLAKARGDAAEMEKLYRQACDSSEKPLFRDAIAQCAAERSDDILLSAWLHRLDLQSSPSNSGSASSGRRKQVRHWSAAVGTSVGLGIAFALLTGEQPPVPIPGEGASQFWIGWAPLTALCVLAFLVAVNCQPEDFRRVGLLGLVLLALAVLVVSMAWNRTDDVARLIALHLPFAAWALVGAGVALEKGEATRQQYAFLVKSVEALLAGAVYFVAGAIFLGLTNGIFGVLGIELPESALRLVTAWGLGAVPILALASVYDPTALPVMQDWTSGLSRILRLLTRIFLPLALGVLVVYVFWFIPSNFWHPFHEREVLIIYNATILGLLLLLSLSAVEPVSGGGPLLRHALLALAVLTALLNAYALAANGTRIFELGLTPNRYAVAGWNLVTLLMLSTVIVRLWRAEPRHWVAPLRRGIALASVLAVVWSVWVVLGLPLSYL